MSDQPVDTNEPCENEVRSKPRARMLAWLVGLIVLALLVAAAYVRFDGWPMTKPSSTVSMPEQTALVAASMPAAHHDQQAFEKFKGQQQAQFDQAQRLTAERLARVERRLSEMQGVSFDIDQTWYLREAEYFLQMAGARLHLVGDIASAKAALRAADERLAAARDPALLSIRQAIQQDLLALSALVELDHEGIVLSLGELAKQVPSLPHRWQDEPHYTTPSAAMAEAETTQGWARAKQATASALRSVIEIRKIEMDLTTVMGEEAKALHAAQLRMLLVTARLALLQQSYAHFSSSLAEAESVLGLYFDPTAPMAKEAKATLQRLQALPLEQALPTLSDSMQALSAYLAGQQS